MVTTTLNVTNKSRKKFHILISLFKRPFFEGFFDTMIDPLSWQKISMQNDPPKKNGTW